VVVLAVNLTLPRHHGEVISLGSRFRRQALAPQAARPLGFEALTAQRGQARGPSTPRKAEMRFGEPQVENKNVGKEIKIGLDRDTPYKAVECSRRCAHPYWSPQSQINVDFHVWRRKLGFRRRRVLKNIQKVVHCSGGATFADAGFGRKIRWEERHQPKRLL